MNKLNCLVSSLTRLGVLTALVMFSALGHAATCPCDFVGKAPPFGDRVVGCDTAYFNNFKDGGYGAGFHYTSNGASITARLYHPKNGSFDEWSFSVGDNIQGVTPTCYVNHRKQGKTKSRNISRDNSLASDITLEEWNACIQELEQLALGIGMPVPLENFGEIRDCYDSSIPADEIRDTECDGNEPADAECDRCQAATNSCDPANSLLSPWGTDTNGDKNYDWVTDDLNRF